MKSEKSMFILGANAAGLFNKRESFLRNISLFNPGVFFIQESKARIKNKIVMNDYITFELLRNNSGGGGLLTAVHKSLNPVSIICDDDEELLIVEAKLAQSKVRFINGYGPQEKAPEDSRKSFFHQLDLEVKKSKLAGSLICIEMDSNAKLGAKIIPGDPKEQSENGKLLEKVILENELIVINSTELCHGIITRHRTTINSIEESVLDHFIVCKDFFKLVINMTIDEAGKYSLTKFTNRDGSTICAKESDHRTLILEIKYSWDISEEIDKRIEIFNYKNNEDFVTFQTITENNEELKHCFDDPNEDIEKSSQRWLRIVKNLIKTAFKKIRIRNNRIHPKLEKLFLEKEHIKSKIAENENGNFNVAKVKLDKELEHVNEEIAQICAEKNKKLVDEYLGRTNDVFEGYGQAKTWALKKKLCPKNTFEAPAAKKDDNGKLVTDRTALENLYSETYKKRLKPNPTAKGFEDLYNAKEFLYDLQMKLARSQVSEDWTFADLKNALKKCKNGKARDEHGFVYELFKYGGLDLKSSLLNLFNIVKRSQKYPLIFSPANISSFWKKKGDKSNLDNDRGVFNVTKIRSIMDRMIYNDIYDNVDRNMSCSNIGARKKRSINDHLFVINGIINDVLHSRTSSNIDVQIYDVSKCFDKLEYVNTAADLYNAGVTDDFVTIANSNKNCQIAVKTPWGTNTNRTNFQNIEMQGTVLAGLKCSVTIDTIGKEYLQNTHSILYKYKNTTSIPPLSLIDDILAVSTCSSKSIQTNATIESKIVGKRLKLGQNKCFQMHIGKTSQSCPSLNVNSQQMLTANCEKYLGQVISSNGKLEKNITERYNKGLGIVNEILCILKEVSFGYYYFRIAMLFRN